MKNVFVICLGFLVLAAVACKKDKDDDNPGPGAAVQAAVRTPWVIDTVGLDVNSDGTIDQPFPEPIDPCERDDVFTFSEDSTGVFSDGAVKCNVDDPDTITFNWHLKNDDKTISLSGLPEAQLNGDANILTLNNTSFIISKPVQILGNVIISLKATN